MSGATRLAWLSPYGPSSDIGAFTRAILPHMAQGEGAERFDCDLFINTCGQIYDSPVPAMEIPEDGTLAEVLARYDTAGPEG